MLEKVAATQMISHMETYDLLEPCQSAYFHGHSTKTALLKVQSDILEWLDKHQGVFMVLLDLSAAFDTIDHSILLHRLQNNFGISGAVLNWLQSYLSHRSIRVSISGVSSDSLTTKFGVPQGSVLGPVLFSTYLSPLGGILLKHGIKYHFYAADIQLYRQFTPGNQLSETAACNRLEKAISDISDWMLFNKLNSIRRKQNFRLFVPNSRSKGFLLLL